VIREAKRKSLYQGIRLGKNQVQVSMLQFVDDTIFFRNVNVRNIFTIKCAFEVF